MAGLATDPPFRFTAAIVLVGVDLGTPAHLAVAGVPAGVGPGAYMTRGRRRNETERGGRGSRRASVQVLEGE